MNITHLSMNNKWACQCLNFDYSIYISLGKFQGKIYANLSVLCLLIEAPRRFCQHSAAIQLSCEIGYFNFPLFLWKSRTIYGKVHTSDRQPFQMWINSRITIMLIALYSCMYPFFPQKLYYCWFWLRNPAWMTPTRIISETYPRLMSSVVDSLVARVCLPPIYVKNMINYLITIIIKVVCDNLTLWFLASLCPFQSHCVKSLWISELQSNEVLY